MGVNGEKPIKENKETTKLFAIEELAKKFDISAGVFAGAKVHNKWMKGKCLTGKAFLEGIDSFSKASIKGVR